MTRNTLLITIAIVALILVGAYLYFGTFGTAPEAEVSASGEPEPRPEPETTPEPAPPPPLELPALGESDELVRRLTGELSTRPELAKWLVSDALIQRFVKAVSNVALGESPSAHLKDLAPAGPFEVTQHDGKTFIAASSYRRYDLFAAVVSSIDTAGAVRLYRDLYPLFEEAYGELGNPDHFEDAVRKAIDRLLAVPVPEGEVEVNRRTRSYEFADPRLEELGEAEKHLLRMGAHNAREVQAKLRAIKSALALTQSAE